MTTTKALAELNSLPHINSAYSEGNVIFAWVQWAGRLPELQCVGVVEKTDTLHDIRSAITS